MLLTLLFISVKFEPLVACQSKLKSIPTFAIHSKLFQTILCAVYQAHKALSQPYSLKNFALPGRTAHEQSCISKRAKIKRFC